MDSTTLSTYFTPTTVHPSYNRFIPLPLPAFVTYFFISLCFVGFFVGSVGNILVILAISKTKKLRTAANAFLASLAFADLSTCLLVLPILALAFISLETVVTVQVLCRLYYHLSLTFSPVSIQHLIVIAINRYILINRSHSTYIKLFNRTLVLVVIVFIWISNIILNVAVAINSYKTARYYDKDFCYVEQTNMLGIMFWLMTILTTFLSCFVIIPLFYVLTFRTVHKSRTRVEHDNLTSDWPGLPTVSSDNPAVRTAAPYRQPRGFLSSSEIKLTKVNCLIFLTNLLFLSPLLLVLIFGGNGALTHGTFSIILLPMGMNSVTNPWVYCGFNRHFRQAFRKLTKLS